MDMLFFFVACLGLAETVDLFMGKDFLIFMGDKMDEKDYDLPKVFAVEKPSVNHNPSHPSYLP